MISVISSREAVQSAVVESEARIRAIVAGGPRSPRAKGVLADLQLTLTSRTAPSPISGPTSFWKLKCSFGWPKLTEFPPAAGSKTGTDTLFQMAAEFFEKLFSGACLFSFDAQKTP